ncbi:MDR family oxidoreductase [Pseudomonas sp. HR96]|uniref:acrylyl-CoA reductase (NADPH) n=1 Tax=Pseudomonas sp. HR96 TaxID=1027966 RepID=UPI002A757F5F|nr:MDR family oxidoreductase [Pseudomonas sp. HR96]WPO97840.1 MDR family oxidoreductase [Pseudomonas sp. HR96]
MFNAIVIDKADPANPGDKSTRSTLTRLDDAQLPQGEVTVRVDYSTLNYKDALAITGRSPIARILPLVPGIDLAGIVEHSSDPRYAPGDAVLLNGWGVGESHWGGLAGKARVKADWLIPLPAGISARQAMAIGTAGYTSMLCIIALERAGLRPQAGPVLVTGANGGVGSIAIALLAAAGYQVIAATGRPQESEHLQRLGASEVIDRASLSEPGRALGKERWAAAVDSVGSHTLANVCAQTHSDGWVAACGLAQGMDFPGSVAPFILRGVSLLGINSVTRPYAERVSAWARLAEQLDFSLLDSLTREIGLDQAIGAADDLLAGRVRGRLVVATQES